jgi:hypothetical protein
VLIVAKIYQNNIGKTANNNLETINIHIAFIRFSGYWRMIFRIMIRGLNALNYAIVYLA